MSRKAYFVVPVITLCLMLVAGFSKDKFFFGGPHFAGGTGGTAVSAGDTVTLLYVFELDPASGKHTHAEFAADSLAAAATGGIILLSDADEGFAFAILDSLNSNTKYSSVDANGWYRTTVQSGTNGTAADRWRGNKANRRVEMFRIQFEKDIPAGSQIVSAKLKMVGTDVSNVMAAADSLAFTLMTNEADSLWHQSVGLTSPSTGLTRAAHATWRYQVSGLNVEGYPAANGGAWVPDLNNRPWFWDYGDYTDWNGMPNGSSQTAFTNYSFSIINCVQAAVNGATNNGIAVNYSDNNIASSTAQFMGWEITGASFDKYARYCVIKYVPKRYRSPWPGGADWAFSIQADDGRNAVNTMLIDSLAVRSGGKFTAYVTEPVAYATDPTYIPWETLLDGCAAGIVEVGSHSIYSWPEPEGSGLNHYAAKGAIAADGSISEWTLGMYPDTLTAAATVADTLYYDVDPEWMNYWAEQAGFSSLVGSSMFAKSFGVPVANHNPWAQKALMDVGYSGVRILASMATIYDDANNRIVYTLGAYRPAESDTIYPGLRPHHRGVPRNLRFISNWPGIDNIVGNKATNLSEAAIKHRMRMAVQGARAQGRKYIGMLVHDTKATEDAPGQYTTSALDADEASYIFDVVDELGGRYMTISEIGNWLYGNSNQDENQPVGWGVPDSFIIDSAWGMPLGVADTFIPNFR